MILDDRLYTDPELAQFYDTDNEWAADLEYCRGLAATARSLLDLGCGTGLFLSRVAEGRLAVGVDPAEAMLEIARRRPGGDRVTWIAADARDLRLDVRFDLIVLTGHAFQVFLTEDDQRAVMSTIGMHLAPEGRFIFDSRNPWAEEWREWSPKRSRRSFDHPCLGRVEAWNDAAMDAAAGIVTYQSIYRVNATGRCHSAESRIKFTDRDRLAALMDESGLLVDRWLGDWTGGDYDPASPEIIPLGRAKIA